MPVAQAKPGVEFPHGPVKRIRIAKEDGECRVLIQAHGRWWHCGAVRIRGESRVQTGSDRAWIETHAEVTVTE